MLVASLAGTADAGVIIDVYQSGSNVVASGSGSINLSGLTFVGTFTSDPGVTPIRANMYVGSGGALDFYSGASGPASFGSGGPTSASSGTGGTFGVNGIGGNIIVPHGYVSGSSLSGSDTYDNTTIAGLGLTPGTYTYTWVSITGPLVDDSLTVNIASVPEPSSLVMACMAATAGLITAWRRRPWKRSRTMMSVEIPALAASLGS
jgi:hypothetical protein